MSCVRLAVQAAFHHRADLQHQEQHARQALVNFHGMKIMDDRMLDVAFQQALQIPRGGGENALQPLELAPAEMVAQEARRVRAALGLMVKESATVRLRSRALVTVSRYVTAREMNAKPADASESATSRIAVVRGAMSP